MLVRRVGRGLLALGVPPRARTAILASNRLVVALYFYLVPSRSLMLDVV